MRFLSLNSFVIIVSLCLKNVHLNAVLLFEDDTCVVNGTNGICKLLQDCPAAIGKLKHQKIAPQICSFQKKDPIVCCTSRKRTRSTPSTHRPGVVENKSFKMCQEYGKSVFTTITSPLLSQSKNVHVSQCAIDTNPLIVGGLAASRKQFPHMARIGFGTPEDKSWGCGGALISDKYVLTLGRCIFSMQYVQVGDLQDLPSLTNIQEFNVVATYTPGSKPRPSIEHNIGLLELDRPVTFNSFVRPACLHTELNVLPKAIVSGLGTACSVNHYNAKPYKIYLQILNDTECKSRFSGYVPEYHLCAEDSGKDFELCESTSGDVLQIFNKDVYCMYDLIGVTSSVDWSKGYALYTRVLAYVPWIESIVWP